MQMLRTCILSSLLCLAVAFPALASPVTFSFSGAVGSVGGGLYPGLAAGQTLNGSFTYDTSKTDSVNSDAIGRYNGAITDLQLNLGLYHGVLGPAGPNNGNYVRIVNAATYAGTDSFEVRAPVVRNAEGLVFDHESIFFRLVMKDPLGKVFGTDHLPTTAPSLNSFASDKFRIVFEDSDGVAKVRGNLTTLTAVPLPPAVILFGAGLLALVGLSARNWRYWLKA